MKTSINTQNHIVTPLSLIAALILGGCASTGTSDTSTLANKQSPATLKINPAQVIATVNGQAIGKSALPHNDPGKPSSEDQLLDEVIARELIWQDFASKDLSSDAATQEQLNNMLRIAYSQVAADHYMKSLKITDDELRKTYELKKSALISKQYKLKHILVADEATANGAIVKLGKGEKFDKLVKLLSKDEGSKGQGGDLGWVDPRAMGPAFDRALASVKSGELVSQPIETQYGWHVILVEDTRVQDAPAFETIKDKLSASMRMEKFQEYIKTLKAKASITKNGAPKVSQVSADKKAE
jgi:peptidyl-prolyl cis-trans isomerase C